MSDSDAQPKDAFPHLSETDIEALTPFGERRRLHDGDSLFEVGDRRGGFFVVLSGSVEIIDPSGDEPRTVAVQGAGEFTGDVDILSRRRSAVGAVARGDTEVMGVSSADIRRVIGERPELGELILKAFIARRELLVESGFEGLRVMGSDESRDAFQIREFLSRNQVPHTWIDVEEDPGIWELLSRFGLGEDDMPVVAYGSRPLLRNPSIRELADMIGLRRSPGRSVYDLVVVGAGPAGLAAAVYGSSEGLNTLVLDGVAPGGQAGDSTNIENYLGFPTGISGSELTGRATLQAQKFGARFSTPSLVIEMELNGSHPVLRLDSGENVNARCILIATGADYRTLDVPGRERFDGLGVYYAATQTELTSCGESQVIVVGGGNSAGQAVMFLSQHTPRVLVLLRGDDLRKSMSSYLAGRIEEAENVEVLYHTEIREVKGNEKLEAVEVEDTRSGERRTIPTPAVFTFIGANPCTGWLPPEIEMGDKGFIRTGRSVADTSSWPLDREPFLLETSVPGVFAAGDVRLGSIKRVASAVGEGAMAVKFIHQYLAELHEAERG